ncbi:hypothetical protein MPH_01420 [Macrophomina phaseolina MS6]|uniref:DUF7587 domain-containing protein n=1 Tax=Macrophomina phaseolina (strain MS6) TaxID=1126212 RepID=K2S8R6_MACPH|nr:hypothetical protein MPH_01420 [Macrophomina phaseolina MS6]
MFYDVDRAFKDVTKVLNALFQPAQEPFRPRQVHAQWAVLQFIFRKRSVYDPKRAWLEKRTELEAAAERAGVHLTPRTTEIIVRRPDPEHVKRAEEVAAQDAWFIKHLLEPRERCVDSTSTRTSPPADGFSHLDKSLAFQLLEAANSGDRPSTSLGHHATEQPIPDQRDTAAPTPSPYRQPQTTLSYAPVFPKEDSDDSGKPALLYRVYHEESCGHNSPTGFRAGLFNIPGQSLEPPPQDNRILPVFVSWHLWHHSVSSPFISCTDSLVMAVHKARQAEAAGLHPHLALISGAAATSNGHTCFRAGPLVLEARSRGLVPGMRYRGVREWLIWGEIACDAIVRDVPFGRLRDLPANHTGVADLLALDDIDPAPRVSLAAIRKGLLRQEVVLDGAAGFHVGRLVALLGLELASPVEMVEQVVYDILQGWVLGVAVGEVPGMAEAFLAGFRDAEGGRSIGAGGNEAVLLLDDDDETGLRAAFASGVERALEDLRRERRYVRK